MKVLSLVTNFHSPFYQNQSSILEQQGIELTQVYPRKQSKEHEERIKMSRTYWDYLPLFYNSFSKILSDYDLIHANNGKTAPFALMQPHRPVVLTLWGSDLMGSYSSISKHSAKYCDEVIVRSEEMNSMLDRDAHVIPAGVNLSVFKPIEQNKAQQKVGWDSHKKQVLFPASPDRSVKNYPLAKSVVESVDSQLDLTVELQVVSGVSHSQIPLYMNAADVLLLTSKREGSPNTVKEAMACNTPVVSTDVGDVRERLDGVEQSAVCNTESKLVDALLSVLQSEAPSNGREHIQDISLEKMGERIVEVYEKARK